MTGKRFRADWKRENSHKRLNARAAANQPERRKHLSRLEIEHETLAFWENQIDDALGHLQFQHVGLAVQSLRMLRTWINDKRRGRRPASDAKAQQPTYHPPGSTDGRGEKPHAYDNGTATESPGNLSKSAPSK